MFLLIAGRCGVPQGSHSWSKKADLVNEDWTELATCIRRRSRRGDSKWIHRKGGADGTQIRQVCSRINQIFKEYLLDVRNRTISNSLQQDNQKKSWLNLEWKIVQSMILVRVGKVVSQISKILKVMVNGMVIISVYKGRLVSEDINLSNTLTITFHQNYMLPGIIKKNAYIPFRTKRKDENIFYLRKTTNITKYFTFAFSENCKNCLHILVSVGV